MTKPIKVGLITHAGGAHGHSYITSLAGLEECGSVVLADPDKNWEEYARQQLGDKLTHVYRDYAQLLSREKPTMALVTMEARLAPPVIEAALEAECHVLAEKPSCIRAEDFAPLVQKADSKHRFLMLALSNRLNAENVAARRLIAAGEIGKIYGLEMHLVADQTRLTRPSYQKEWYTHKDRSGGGHLIWLGIHWLDLAMHITGSKITEVAGFTANVGGQPIDIEDSAVAALKFDNGTLGTVTSGYYLDKGYHSHIKIWGSRGWLQLEGKDKPLHWLTTEGEKAGVVQKFEGSKESRGYAPLLREAIRACTRMDAPPISNSDSLHVLQTVFAVYQSAETGRAQRIE